MCVCGAGVYITVYRLRDEIAATAFYGASFASQRISSVRNVCVRERKKTNESSVIIRAAVFAIAQSIVHVLCVYSRSYRIQSTKWAKSNWNKTKLKHRHTQCHSFQTFAQLIRGLRAKRKIREVRAVYGGFVCIFNTVSLWPSLYLIALNE